MIPYVILKNDFKIHVFLESVESARASAPASRIKDPAQLENFPAVSFQKIWSKEMVSSSIKKTVFLYDD